MEEKIDVILKLLLVQMQNQDPLDPINHKEMFDLIQKMENIKKLEDQSKKMDKNNEILEEIQGNLLYIKEKLKEKK